MVDFPKKAVEEIAFSDASSRWNSGILFPTISFLLFRDVSVEYQNRYKNQPANNVLLMLRELLFSTVKGIQFKINPMPMLTVYGIKKAEVLAVDLIKIFAKKKSIVLEEIKFPMLCNTWLSVLKLMSVVTKIHIARAGNSMMKSDFKIFFINS